ncbi:MAG: hypothetical protein NC222_06985 [Staphylococcus sp.]|nr:hypothetical protein [Staphylococcus sp.]
MVFSGLFKKEPKLKYVVYKTCYDVVIKSSYETKEFLEKGIKIISYTQTIDGYTNHINIKVEDVLKDEIETESEADIFIYFYKNMKEIDGAFKKTQKELYDFRIKLEEKESKLIHRNKISYDELTYYATYLKRIVYVLTGEYPNYSISKKNKVIEDDFNYCLKEINTNIISLWPKYKCFDTYEEANNKVLELIQKEANKEHPCTCKCTSKKK